MVECADIIQIIIAIFFPPLAVFLSVGCGCHFWLNILLCILGILPGQIHAVWVVLKYEVDAAPS